jgi:hypothetical protein
MHMKQKFYFLFLLVFSLMTVVAQGQALRITGTVRDESTGLPLSGASILVVETKKGTSTDKDGNFSLTVTGRSSVSLLISSVGYRSTQVKTDGRSPVTVSLGKEAASQLDEVVVV